MSNMNFICPTCKHPTQQADNEIIEYLANEIGRYTDVLGERTKELERTRKALDVALDWLEQVATPEKCDDELCREFTSRKLTEIKTTLEQKKM